MSEPSRPRAVPEPLRRRAIDVYRRLRALALDLYRQSGGRPDGAETFELPVTIDLGRAGMREVSARHGESMLQDLLRKTDDLAASLLAVRPGRAYCFFCRSSSCTHSEPPGALSALAGYVPTGRPRWIDFPSLALEARDPRIDAVFSERPEVIALFRPGEALLAELLPDFRTPAAVYDLLGEVIVGPLPMLDAATGRTGEAAITIQIVRCLGRDGEPELRLNSIGRVPGGDDLRRFLDAGGDDALARTLAIADHELESLNRRLRGSRRAGKPPLDPAEPSDVLLRRLARRIEQIYRQRGRRTHHAQFRAAEGVRPTRKALDDARTARPQHVYVDERGGTIVILGPKGRVHVFSPAGRHVTSLTATGEEIQGRIDRRRWRAASVAEVSSFKSAIDPANGR
jgi:hypothetical protein